MNKEKLMHYLKKPAVRNTVTILLILGAVIAGLNYFSGNGEKPDSVNNIAKEVKASILELNGGKTGTVQAVGIVKPETKIAVVAMANGTVRNLNFKIGDSVFANQSLALLSNQQTTLSLLNAQTNLTNQQSNQAVTALVANENIRQAEIGVAGAEDAIKAAEVALKTTQENLENALALREKSNLDVKKNSLINFNAYLNDIDNALDQISFLLGAENEEQLAGIENVLGVENLSTLNQAKSSYRAARKAYEQLTGWEVSTGNITAAIEDAVDSLSLAKKLLDETLVVLDNTISSADFTKAELSTQKNNFLSLRSSIINTLSGAENNLQALSNLDLVNNQETDSLRNAVEAAEKQLQAAQTGYSRALSSFEVVEQNNKLQILGAESRVDNARSQFNITQSQAADLNVKAPISGKITAKYVELGTEVSPGQKIAELSQLDMVIIEAEIPSEDARKISNGQEAVIDPEDKKLIGNVSRIYPTADPASKKVKIEIAFNNENKDLIPESFVSVNLPATAEANGSKILYIPLKALTVGATENYVFLVENEKAVKTVVEIGAIEGEQVEIKSGLKDGNVLIIEGAKNLEPDDDVKVIGLAD